MSLDCEILLVHDFYVINYHLLDVIERHWKWPHLYGVQGVGGSNPLAPTNSNNELAIIESQRKLAFLFCDTVSGTV